MQIEPELGECSIVLLGHFNPIIFSPLWFAKNGIVSEEAAKAATVSGDLIIHPRFAAFQLGSIRLQVEETRLFARTSEAPWVNLCDFIARTFGEFLVHTPINQMGINRTVHFSVGSEETRNKIGRIIAPPEPWGIWGKEIEASRGSMRDGCVNLTMLQHKTACNGYTGFVQVSVQPSDFVRANAGLFVTVNDHYEFKPMDKTVGCNEVIDVLIGEFEGSIRNSEEKIDIVMEMKDFP